MPAEMRTRSSGRPRARRTSAGMEAWLMKHGSETSDEVEPKETVTLKSLRCSESAFESATLPVSKESSEPPPLAWAGGEEKRHAQGNAARDGWLLAPLEGWRRAAQAGAGERLAWRICSA